MKFWDWTPILAVLGIAILFLLVHLFCIVIQFVILYA